MWFREMPLRYGAPQLPFTAMSVSEGRNSGSKLICAIIFYAKIGRTLITPSISLSVPSVASSTFP
ncbi:MAG: hypothetical protein IJJ71_03840, partial [Treponema sp.]|uniref:hypothetical protein n=1 Tax=Treponema sp. TaxID=166 RepID=UPI0025F769E9